MAATATYRHAMILVSASSLMVPVIGLATAPILTHALGIAGRGEAGAALGPNLLIVGGATLGLPQALTYLLAKRPQVARSALGWAAAISLILGAVTLVASYVFQDYLSGNDAELGRLIVLATWLALPALLVGLLRGAATGLQMWRAVALERVLNSVIRLVLFVLLAVTGNLTVISAVLVMCLGPVVAGVAYWRVFVSQPVEPGSSSNRLEGTGTPRTLLSFGSKVWLGSIATMLMARMSQLLVTPLAGVEQLGLLIVAITISDIPYIVTQTVRDVAFGASSADNDAARLQMTSRLATAAAGGGSLILGLTLHWWLEPVFGAGFDRAQLPTLLLLASSVIAVPGLIAGAGLDAAGRPALRSTSLIVALVVSVGFLIALTPVWGATGAALGALLGTIVSTSFVLICSRFVTRTNISGYCLLQRGDLGVMRSMASALVRRVRRVAPDRQ